MEYMQMTLDDWAQMKQKLRQELIGVKQSFVRIGYALRQIDDQRLYENDGYKSIAEFAKAEYGLEASTTSRFMSINREYSIDGYSEHLRPEYTDLGRSQLEEMLKLPDADRQMIQPEASREDIRELKRFNKTEPAAGVADDISQLIEKFFEDNKDILNEVYSNEFDEESMSRFAEIVNPAGNRSFKKGLYFMMMYENRVTIKKFGDTPKNMQSMAEVIALDLEKLNLSKLAIEKAVMMIARAIAKSDIIVQTDSTQKSSIEYRLNVMPNDHECGTYFWTRIIRELLWTQEALIIPMNGKYYKASAWQESNSVLSERIYSNITIECAGEQYGLYKKFMSSEVIHLRYDNAKIRVYLESVVNQYNNTLNAINYMIRLSNQPKFKLKLGAAQSFREKQADGTDKIVTKDMYAEKIKRMLESEDLTVMTESEGVSLENIQINASAKAEELAKVALAINNEAANAFDIPEAVFNGNITEKSDATNEFITYACSPVAEVINDTLTAYIVGENDYSKKCERVLVWLARFKHVDVVDSAVNLDKLRGIGFSYDELREMVGYPLLNTDFSQARALTKNYAEEGQNEKTEELI